MLIINLCDVSCVFVSCCDQCHHCSINVFVLLWFLWNSCNCVAFRISSLQNETFYLEQFNIVFHRSNGWITSSGKWIVFFVFNVDLKMQKLRFLFWALFHFTVSSYCYLNDFVMFFKFINSISWWSFSFFYDIYSIIYRCFILSNEKTVIQDLNWHSRFEASISRKWELWTRRWYWISEAGIFCTPIRKKPINCVLLENPIKEFMSFSVIIL